MEILPKKFQHFIMNGRVKFSLIKCNVSSREECTEKFSRFSLVSLPCRCRQFPILNVRSSIQFRKFRKVQPSYRDKIHKFLFTEAEALSVYACLEMCSPIDLARFKFSIYVQDLLMLLLNMTSSS